jgi:hypothetical protein
VRESTIEKHLVEQVKAAGGMAPKFKSPGRRNVPDRLVLLPGARISFVELKATDQFPSDAQEREHARLRALGFDVRVIDSKEGVNQFLKGGI